LDKLRAIEYFLSAANAGSLSGAAQQFDVTVPAVSKMLASLERHLGIRLFERSTKGLALTPAGDQYVAVCLSIVEQLSSVEESLGRARTHAIGPVALAIQNVLALHCLAPVIAHFHARHPGIQLDVRDYSLGRDADMDGADLRIALVWEESPDQIVRVLARTRMMVCASPAYWARHGLPERPKDLERHTCFVLRAVRGIAMDHWPFERNGQTEAAVVGSWMLASNTNRDVAVAAALAGEGVIRSLDIVLEDHLRQGRLIPALTDWDAVDSPAVRMMVRPTAARLPRVRATIDFLADLFRETERRCSMLAGARPSGKAPPWVGSAGYRKASTAASRGSR